MENLVLFIESEYLFLYLHAIDLSDGDIFEVYISNKCIDFVGLFFQGFI